VQKEKLAAARTGLANICEDACPHCLQMSKKFFRVPIGSSEERSKVLGSSIVSLVTALPLLLRTVLGVQCNWDSYSTGLLEECDKGQNVAVAGLLLPPVTAIRVKTWQ
jgi:hypothetical protein